MKVGRAQFPKILKASYPKNQESVVSQNEKRQVSLKAEGCNFQMNKKGMSVENQERPNFTHEGALVEESGTHEE